MTALANQYFTVNELMQGGENLSVSRKHVKLLVLHQFLGTYKELLLIDTCTIQAMYRIGAV